MSQTMGTPVIGGATAGGGSRAKPAAVVTKSVRTSTATRSDLVVRPRLLKLMDAAARGSLTVLSAPAGYGKSVLAASWSSRVDGKAALVQQTLTEDCRSPVTFWVSALESLDGGGVDTSGLHVAPSADDVSPRTVTRVAQRIASHDQPVIWVLDCDEFTLSATVGHALHQAIRGSAGRLHLVVLTRADPPLPLHRYRLHDELTEIRAADLAFVPGEAAALLRRAGIDLAPPELAALQARTTGWPAGLRFAAMGLAGRADAAAAIREFRGDTGNMAAYLMTEVLAKQPPETQEFLLRTCLVDALDPGLAGALTGRYCDQRVLQFMAHGNSFIVPPRGTGAAYRYQPLFREFLRSELAFQHPDLVPELHRVAAAWYADAGRPREALRHAVAAKAWRETADYLVEGLGVAALLVDGDRRALCTLLAPLPSDSPGATAAVARAAKALDQRDPAGALAELASARRQMTAEPGSASPACRLSVVVLEAVAASLGADLDAALDAAMAAESAVLTAPVGGGTRHAETLVLVAACKGRVLLERGDFVASSAAYASAIDAADAAGLEGLSVELRGMAALAEAASGRLSRASQLSTWTASDGAGGSSVIASSQAGALALAWVRLDEYDLDAAEALLDEMPQLLPSSEGRLLQAVHALVRARLLRTRGRPDLAGASVRGVRFPGAKDGGTSWIRHALVVSQSASLVAGGHPQQAAELLGSIAGCVHPGCALAAREASLACGTGTLDTEPLVFSSTPPLQVEVESLLVSAGQHLQDGDLDSAERSIEAALHLAIPEHLRRPFFESPREVRELLESTGRMSRLHQPATRVQQHPSADVALSAREQEVLEHLAELLTTEEIAQSMFVSVNTVRSHVRSVLRKLDVARRNEAVRRAWELNLLPQRPGA